MIMKQTLILPCGFYLRGRWWHRSVTTEDVNRAIILNLTAVVTECHDAASTDE